ncbi:MAG: cohesin domain-containing protein [Anaerolineae bacterium]
MTITPCVRSRRIRNLLILSLVVAFVGLSLASAGAQPIEVSIPDIQQTDSPAGASPLLGQVVTVDGIVTALDPREGGLDGYFIEEPEGGAWSGVYVADSSGNRPAVGDQVRITGLVDEISGFTTVTNLDEFTVVSNGNPLPAAWGITAAMLQTNGEPWESVWTAVHGLTVIDENPDAPDDFGEWLLSDATDATVRVGHLLGDYVYSPIEGDELVMVRGVVYFSVDTFKLEPLSSADILEQRKYNTIYEIQTVPDESEDDASPLNGERVTTAGVVTGVFFPPDGGARYAIQDVRGGPWSGVWVYQATGQPPARGSHVELAGTVREFFGRTELFDVGDNDISVDSVSNTLPAAAEIHTIDIATGRPSAESYEGVLIRVGPVTVTNANPDAPDDFGEWLMADWTGASVRVDDLGNYQYEPVEADELAFVRGVVDFTFDQFKTQPRDDADIGTSAVTIGQARERAVGEQVSLQGLVTVPAGLLDAGFAIQDGTGGIYVYHENGYSQPVNLGDVVDVNGVLANDHGRLQVVPGDPVTDVQVVGQAPLPPPLQWPTGAIGESSEGWLVLIDGTVLEKEIDRLILDDGSGPVDVFVAAGADIDLKEVIVGQEATIVGLSSQFDDAPYEGGYRVLPRFQSDVIPSGPAVLTPTASPSPTPTPEPAAFTVPLPTLFKNHGGCTSVYTLINPGDFEANVLHELVDDAENVYSLLDTVGPGEERLYDLATVVYSPPLPDDFSGSGTIESDQPLTASVQVCPAGGLATVVVNPDTRTVEQGGTISTTVQVLSAAGLYGAELHIEFNPAILQVVDADPDRPGVQVLPGALFTERDYFAAANQADNLTGTIDFAAALLNPEPPIDGGGDLITITWRGVAAGSTTIHLARVDLSDQAGQLLPARLEDGSITVLPSTPTTTPTPTPTSTPTPAAPPACDGGMCGGSLVVRAFYDFRCDGGFNAGVDHGIGGARLTLTYDNGVQITAETGEGDFGYVYFNGVNLPDGATATLSVEWPAAAGATLSSCPNSRDAVTLTAEDFSFGSRMVYFRAMKTRQ